jgi:hypothetical protein
MTYVRTAVLVVTDSSIQIFPSRPHYIKGLGREWFPVPSETRIRVSNFRSLFWPFNQTPFIVFSRVEPDGTEIDLLAITRRNRLDEIQAALKVAGVKTRDECCG